MDTAEAKEKAARLRERMDEMDAPRIIAEKLGLLPVEPVNETDDSDDHFPNYQY